MPDLSGMAGDKAAEALTAAGITSVPSFKDEAGKETVIMRSNWSVTGQSPSAGESVAANVAVTLTVHHDSADAAAGACPHHHLAADPGFEAASEIDGEPMVPLAQAERALHHLAARLLHQPTVMARRAGQEGREEAYRQALELVWGLESTGENHD